MYKVVKRFTDKQDGHVYNVGDAFPADGVTVSQARLDKLASDSNRQGTPLIVKAHTHTSADSLNSATPVEPDAPAQQEAPVKEGEKKVAKPKKSNNRKKSED